MSIPLRSRALAAALLLALTLGPAWMPARAQGPPSLEDLPREAVEDMLGPGAGAEEDAGGDSEAPGSDESIEPAEAPVGDTEEPRFVVERFDQQRLDGIPIVDVEALALHTPGLHVSRFSEQVLITLRGVGVENRTRVGEPGVAFEVDGIHRGRPSISNTSFFDVGRVDVSAGPQAVLGGRQSTEGRISLRSRKPGPELAVFGDLQYGAYDQFRARAVANVPIWGETLLSRATATLERRGGYQDFRFTGVRSDNAGDARDFSGRFQLRSLLLDDSVELLGIGSYALQKGNGPAWSVLGPPDASATDAYEQAALSAGFDVGSFVRPCVPDRYGRPGSWPPPAIAPGGVTCVSDDPRETWADLNGRQDDSQAGFTGHAGWDLPFLADNAYLSDLHLQALGGFHRSVEDSLFDPDGTNAPSSLYDRRSQADQGTLEVFLERTEAENLDFKIGLFYYREQLDTRSCYDASGSDTGSDVASSQDVLSQSVAGYGHADYRLVENLRLRGGLRYSIEMKDMVQTNERFTSTGANAANDLGQGCGVRMRNFLQRQTGAGPTYIVRNVADSESIRADKTWHDVAPRVGFDWEIAETSTFSFSYASSFKAGGFPLGRDDPMVANRARPYAPEEVSELEASWKSWLFDDRLRLDLTLFWSKHDSFQICQVSGPLDFCQSDGRALRRGVELEWEATPLQGLRIDGHFNFLDARVSDYHVADPARRSDCGAPPCAPAANASPEDLAGNFLPRSPQYSGSLGVQYAFDAGSWGVLTPRVQAQGQSRSYMRVFNREDYSQKPYVKVDLSLSWLSADERIVIAGFVDNVTDVDVLTSLFVGPQALGGPVMGHYLAPRTWGIRVGVNFVSGIF